MATMRLYRVTFNDGRQPVNHRASCPQTASLALSLNGGSDIASMELLAVDSPSITGKQARKIARLAGVSSRHMLALPAKVMARYAMCPTATVELNHATDKCVTFSIRSY